MSTENNYKIYLDMDGVIVDWENQFKRISNGISPNEYEKMYGETKRFKLSQDSSPDFYANMQWTKDGKELYEFLKNYDTEILSHAETQGGSDTRVVDGKLKWLKNNDVNIKANLVPHREDKAKYANGNSILIDDREDNIQDFKDSGGIGILHTSTKNTINELKKIMGEPESSFDTEPVRIYNSILNPVLWDNKTLTLKKHVSEKLLNAAYRFYSDSKLKAPIKDIFLFGSTTGYNWNPTSDIDVQIVIDFDYVVENKPNLVRNYVSKIKDSWKSKYDIKIKNHEVELNIRDINDTHHSESSYSLKRGTWIKKPVYNPPIIDKDKIRKIYVLFKKRINDVTARPSSKKIKSVITDMYKLRERGLDDKGEYSSENLAFKLLRKRGYLQKLKNSAIELTDKQLSIKENIK